MSRAKYVTCPDCMGSGWLDEDGDPYNGVIGSDRGEEECGTCGGRGEILEES